MRKFGLSANQGFAIPLIFRKRSVSMHVQEEYHMAFRNKTASLTVLETRISYFEVGAGKPVLMLHGNPGSKNDFLELAEGFASNDIRFVSLDRPGHGNSEELMPETPDLWYDAKAYAEIIKKTCSGKTYLVGYSLGAFLALKIALQNPEMVTGLGLISPFLAPKDASEAPSSIPDLARSPFLGTVMGIIFPMFAGGKIRRHLIDVYSPKTVSEAGLDDDVKRYTNFEFLLSTMRDKNDFIRLREEVQKRLPELKCSVLAILGGKDAICDPNSQWEVLSKGLSKVQRADIPEGGHGIPFTHSKEVGELLLPHIKANS